MSVGSSLNFGRYNRTKNAHESSSSVPIQPLPQLCKLPLDPRKPTWILWLPFIAVITLNLVVRGHGLVTGALVPQPAGHGAVRSGVGEVIEEAAVKHELLEGVEGGV